MMRRENGRVFIEISEDEWDVLLIVLGFAAGHACDQDWERHLQRSIFRLANSINEGNPNWTPYYVAEEPV